MADRMGVAVAHQQLLADDQHAKRVAEPGPRCEELTRGREDLHAVVAAVGDIDAVPAVDGDRVGSREFGLPFPFSNPF